MTGSVAHLVATYLRGEGIERVFGLCGGHIQPMWDAVARSGIDIVDVRHEGAAVFMAHAAGEVTGTVGVAMVTAGPGVTNAATGIANAWAAGVPLLVISGRVPRPQTGMGAMQDVDQAGLLAPICRSVHQVWDQRQVVPQLDAAFASALGGDGRPGPVYIDFPVDLQEERVDAPNALAPRGRRRESLALPSTQDIEAAAALLRTARRVLVIAGRGAGGAGQGLGEFLDHVDGLFLDSAESKGLLPTDNARYVPAVRGRAIREADLVITLGRRLDFQLGYGSGAVFAPGARFLRVGRSLREPAGRRRDPCRRGGGAQGPGGR